MDIRLRHALARQDVARIDFLARKQVSGLGEFLDLALLQPALARAAPAHTTTVRKVDALAQRSL